jgi:hypothetical protein
MDVYHYQVLVKPTLRPTQSIGNHLDGCPLYVLSASKQTNGIQNKWSERSRVGIYLGRSPQHAQSVALVLSLETGLVSPQFHVSFDPTFQTMRKHFNNNQPISQWQQKAGFMAETTTTSESTATGPTGHTKTTKDTVSPVQSSKVRQPNISIQHNPQENFQEVDPYTSTIWDVPAPEPIAPRVTTSNVSEGAQEMDPSITSINNKIHFHPNPIERIIAALLSMEAIVPEAEMDQHLQHPLLAMAATNDPDTLYYHEAMKAPDKEEFVKSMHEEVQGQINSKVYSPCVENENRVREKSTDIRVGSTSEGINNKKASIMTKPTHLLLHGPPFAYC